MEIVIIGGGIGGLAAAVGLHKIGIKAHVYEQASNFKPLGTGIGIGSNAMLALNKLGVGEDVLKNGMPLHEQRFLDGNSNVMNTIDFTLLKKKFGAENIAIERSDLHRALFAGLDSNYFHFNKKVKSFKQTNEKVTVNFIDKTSNSGHYVVSVAGIYFCAILISNYFHFNKKVHSFKQTNEKVTFNFTDNTSISADYVIAADGIHSIFRQTLIPKSKPRYAGYTCWRGIAKIKNDVELHISSEAWSKKGRFGWAPLYNGYAYWFACINVNENDEYYQSIDQSGLANHFSHFPPVAQRLINETSNEYFLHHDIYDI